MADPNTPTPRTDAEYSLSEHESSKEHYTSEGRAKHSKRGWDFARQLERELADLRQMLGATEMLRLNNALFVEQWERICTTLGIAKCSVIEAVDAVEAERKAREAYEAIINDDGSLETLEDKLTILQDMAHSYAHASEWEVQEAKLKAAERRVKEIEASLVEVAALDPNVDSDEGYNEWGEADCFRQAQEIASKAIRAEADRLSAQTAGGTTEPGNKKGAEAPQNGPAKD